ncbi:uncharacterized protein ATC70_009943 [Mucor velutinosus]|uniref:Reverse transcriptase/retrotransposon-derived protein RNase H-like domain-containing protein n=1 Tax=Mucor velutinosus TaxID=708070 RepID=A0AAN7DN32_9FUNG|nr:hypothetical protein ATC70_009943 [Mucor velutinosus]
MASLRQEAFAQEAPQHQLSSQEQIQQFQSFMNEAAMEREATQQAFSAFQRESQQKFEMMTQQFKKGRAQYAHLDHELKQALINLPKLAYPDSDLLYHLHCDASNVALGSVLIQNGRPVGFASCTLSPAEKNYSTTERECLNVA